MTYNFEVTQSNLILRLFSKLTPGRLRGCDEIALDAFRETLDSAGSRAVRNWRKPLVRPGGVNSPDGIRR